MSIPAGIEAPFYDPRPVAPTFAPLDVTGWDPDDLAEQHYLDEQVEQEYAEDLAAWEERHPEHRSGLYAHDGWVAEILDEPTLDAVDRSLASSLLAVATLDRVDSPDVACLTWRLASAARARRVELYELGPAGRP